MRLGRKNHDDRTDERWTALMRSNNERKRTRVGIVGFCRNDRWIPHVEIYFSQVARQHSCLPATGHLSKGTRAALLFMFRYSLQFRSADLFLLTCVSYSSDTRRIRRVAVNFEKRQGWYIRHIQKLHRSLSIPTHFFFTFYFLKSSVSLPPPLSPRSTIHFVMPHILRRIKLPRRTLCLSLLGYLSLSSYSSEEDAWNNIRWKKPRG